MTYLEHLLLTCWKLLMNLSWLLSCETKYLPFFRFALKMIKDYLQNQKNRNKIGSSYSILEDITFGVPQGSVLWPLLFNVFLREFFLEYVNNYFANYADNTKMHIVDENAKEIWANLPALAQKQYTHGWLTTKKDWTMTNFICFWVLKGALAFK